MPESFGPFIDCTSNQIIAFFEAEKQPQVVAEAARLAKELESDEGKRVATGVKIIVCASHLFERYAFDFDLDIMRI